MKDVSICKVRFDITQDMMICKFTKLLQIVSFWIVLFIIIISTTPMIIVYDEIFIFGLVVV